MVAIKDMEMPSNCFECPIFYDYLYCPLVDKKNESGLDKHRASNCPLIEIEKPKEVWISNENNKENDSNVNNNRINSV